MLNKSDIVFFLKNHADKCLYCCTLDKTENIDSLQLSIFNTLQYPRKLFWISRLKPTKTIQIFILSICKWNITTAKTFSDSFNLRLIYKYLIWFDLFFCAEESFIFSRLLRLQVAVVRQRATWRTDTRSHTHSHRTGNLKWPVSLSMLLEVDGSRRTQTQGEHGNST